MARVNTNQLPPGLPRMGEAASVGPANLNETTPTQQRSADGAGYIPKTDGPVMGDEGEFLPAEYEKVTHITSGPDNRPVKVVCLRRDR